MARKWHDSIEKQKKEEAMFVADGQTDRVNDKNNRLLAIRRGDQQTRRITHTQRLRFDLRPLVL